MTENHSQFNVNHAPYDVGGNSYYLARAEQEYGFNSETIVYFKQWFGYPSDRNLKLKPGTNPFWHLPWWLMMLRVALTCDVLHFNFGGSFLTDVTRGWVFADLPLWRQLGIATFISFQGCDSRISSYVLENNPIKVCENCRSRPFCKETYDNFKTEVISQASRYFDKVFAVNPDLIRNIPNAQFLPYSNCNIDEWRPPADYDYNHPGPVRILHAPTWRELKGTDYIIAAVEELREEGENVELVLVENVPHDQVKPLYESADLLVDQLLVGWYGGLAVELMALGKPVVAYIRQEDLEFIPEKMRDELPIISADSTTLKCVLRQLIQDRSQLKPIGEKSRVFVEQWHHPRVVAKMTTDAYREALEKRRHIGGVRNRIQMILNMTNIYFKQFAKLYWHYSLLAKFRNKLISSTTKIFKITFNLVLPLISFLSYLRLNFGSATSAWGITPILTTPKLAQADRLLGIKSSSIAFTTYRITQSFDYVFLGAVNFLAKRAPSLLSPFYKTVFLWALLKFDVFHFFYDQGFLEREGRFGVSHEELRLLRKAGKRVYLYAYGADVRTKQATLALGKYNCCMHCNRTGVNCICDDDEAARKQAVFRDYATALVSMGDMMEYVPGAKNLYYWPIDTKQIQYFGVSWDGKRPLKIFHAPNHEWAKGSRYLKEVLKKLSTQGIEFELLQVTNVSNEEVLQLMQQVDIIADQFIIGWHGYTTLEALAHGKVVLCYIRDRDMLLEPDECPIISANPDNLEQVLTDMANWSPQRMQELGKQGRQYVEKHFSPSAVAIRLADLYLETADFPSRTKQRIASAKASLLDDMAKQQDTVSKEQPKILV
jgi:glycosyltransferase involved in cell wall biosynthesis